MKTNEIKKNFASSFLTIADTGEKDWKNFEKKQLNVM